jgi:hypothetical protein
MQNFNTTEDQALYIQTFSGNDLSQAQDLDHRQTNAENAAMLQGLSQQLEGGPFAISVYNSVEGDQTNYTNFENAITNGLPINPADIDPNGMLTCMYWGIPATSEQIAQLATPTGD